VCAGWRLAEGQSGAAQGSVIHHTRPVPGASIAAVFLTGCTRPLPHTRARLELYTRFLPHFSTSCNENIIVGMGQFCAMR